MSGDKENYQQFMNKGHSAAWEQDWEQASLFYRQALDEFPDNSNALASLGLALFELHQFGDALKVYARAASVSVEDPIPFEKISQLYELLEKPENAVKAARKAADLYLKKRDSEKAIANLVRATQLAPEDLAARSKLAMVYEGLGRKQQAVNEYINIASIFQHSGDEERALQALNHAITIFPGNKEALKAKEQLQNSNPLPIPARSKIDTDELTRDRYQESENSEEVAREAQNLDPISEAQNNALTTLAELLFEAGDDVGQLESVEGRGFPDSSGYMGSDYYPQEDRNKTLQHLSQAVNLQTQGIIEKAAEELEKAVEAGIDQAAALFNLGLLRSKSQQIEGALQALQQVVTHPEFALAAHLIRGNLFRKSDRVNEALVEYFQALRLADTQVVDARWVDELWNSYDQIIESQSYPEDIFIQERLCDSISSILINGDWKTYLKKVRQDLRTRGEESDLIPLGEIMVEANSLDIVENIATINKLADEGCLRSAMEEAYFALKSGPFYLPLHEQIGDLLLIQNRTDDALGKFTLIAKTYAVRGERKRSTEILRKILNLAPTNLDLRKMLIQQLFDGGQIHEAVMEGLELGEFYVNQAELLKARTSFSETLETAQDADAGAELLTRILHRMADIDMQMLNWQQALQIYSQIIKLQPGDEQARTYLIELNLRSGDKAKAFEELDDYIEFLISQEEVDKAINFVENLFKDNPDNMVIRQKLAKLYGQAGRINEALTHYNAIGQAFLKQGNREAAINIIEQILSLNPPNRTAFESLLERIKGD